MEFYMVVLLLIYILSVVFSLMTMVIFGWVASSYILAIIPIVNTIIGLPLVIMMLFHVITRD